MKIEISNRDKKQIKFPRSLRDLKYTAHLYFDKIWKYNYLSRDEAYIHIAKYLQVEEPQAHMSKMDKKMCKDVIEFCVMILNDMRRLDLDFDATLKHPYYEII